MSRLRKGAPPAARMPAATRFNKLNVPARASLIYTLSGVLCRACSFLLTPIFTRVMSKAALGEYSLFTTYLGLIASIGSLELGTGVLYSLLGENRGRERAVMRYALIAVTVSTSAVSLPFILFHYIKNEGGALPFFPSLFLCSLSRSVLMLFIGGSRYRYRYKTATAVTLVEALAPPIISLLLFPVFTEGQLASVRIVSLAAVLLTLSIPVAISLLSVRKEEPFLAKSGCVSTCTQGAKGDGRSIIAAILGTALPTLPYFALVSLISSLDRIIIAHRLGEVSLAEYGIAYSLGTGVTMLIGGVGGIMTPWIMRKFRSGEYDVAHKCVEKISGLIACLSLLLLSVAPELFRLLAPSEYLGALGCVYPIALSALPLFLSGLIASCLIGSKKRLSLAVSALISASLSLLLNLTLISRGGIKVSAIILYICYTVLLLLLSYNLRRSSGIALISDNSYLQKALLSAIFSSVLYLLREAFLPRLIIATAISLVLVVMLRGVLTMVREQD